MAPTTSSLAAALAVVHGDALSGVLAPGCPCAAVAASGGAPGVPRASINPKNPEACGRAGMPAAPPAAALPPGWPAAAAAGAGEHAAAGTLAVLGQGSGLPTAARARGSPPARGSLDAHAPAPPAPPGSTAAAGSGRAGHAGGSADLGVGLGLLAALSTALPAAGELPRAGGFAPAWPELALCLAPAAAPAARACCRRACGRGGKQILRPRGAPLLAGDARAHAMRGAGGTPGATCETCPIRTLRRTARCLCTVVQGTQHSACQGTGDGPRSIPTLQAQDQHHM